jgi:signal transduction histidine kinase/CheY-like chemotaxis protein
MSDQYAMPRENQERQIRRFLHKAESATLDEVLTDLGAFYQADRAYIFEDDRAKGITVNTYEWCAEGVIPQIDNLQALLLEDIAVIEKTVENGEYVIRSLNDELSPDDPVYKILAPQQIDSLILAALMIDGRVSGYIGVDNPKVNADMSLLLSVVSTVVCTKILTRRQLAENEESFLVLSKLREQYATLYYADFAIDYMHTYKTNDTYRGKYGETLHYSTSMGDYVRNDIAIKDRERMLCATDPTYVMERFQTEDAFVLDFEDHSQGDVRYCQLRYIKANEAGTQAVICGSDLTKEKQESMELHNQLKQQLQVINAVGSEYENLFLVNVKTKHYTQFNANNTGIHKAPLDMIKKYENYEDALAVYFKCFAPEGEQPYLLKQTKADVLLEETPDSGIYSISYNRIDGDRKIHYQLNSAKFVGDDGVTYLVLGFRDVHAIVEEEERKSAALAEMRDIISASEMGTWSIELLDDVEPRFFADKRMLELLGLQGLNLTPEEVYDAWFSHIKPEAVQSVLDSVEKMKQGARDENTYLWIHPVLGERYVRCGGTARKVPGGYVLRGYHYDVDDMVREQMKQEALLKDALMAAEHANRAKTTFLNNMSHDIRTPMNAIIGYTALAASHIDNKEQVQNYLSKITVSSGHLLSLINDVLDMSRIESGRVNIDEKEVHLPDVMHDIRTITQANINAKQLDFFIDTVDVVHEDIICDKLRLNQVLLNILSNATKFTKPGGAISVRVIEKPSTMAGRARYEFHVKDTGIGISPEFQEHIFEPFSREQSSTVSGIQGTGLGMAISKNIIDMMGGAISVKSTVGVGSEFTVCVDFRISDSAVKYVAVPELQGIRALVADDDSNTAISVSNMLKSIGLRSDWTLSGKEAVLRAKVAAQEADQYGVYIIDWLMPDMNGIETVRQIRRFVEGDVPIIILTAYDWSDIEEEAKEAGVTGFVSKPIFLSELRDVLSVPFSKEIGQTTEKHETEKEPVDNFEGKSILIVEDNQLNQEIATEILTQYGFTVKTVDDGSKAVDVMQVASPGQYDLILMDIQMPQMDGYQATKEIRKIQNSDIANIPIIAMTANAFEDDRALAENAGMNAYVTKPIDIGKLIEIIRKFL